VELSVLVDDEVESDFDSDFGALSPVDAAERESVR
jgi:hypothetical protein